MDEIEIRNMTEADVESGWAMCRDAGWNQLPADWRFLRSGNPDGCFVAYGGEGIIGTVTTWNYDNKSSWIAMMLVAESHRRRGIATRLMQAARDSLAECDCVRLDATPVGREVYLRLGFRDEFPLSRMTADEGLREGMLQCDTAGAQCAPVSCSVDLSDIIALDALAFGVMRPKIMEYWLQNAPEYARILKSDGKTVGFCLGRHGRRFEHIGPIIAPDANSAAAMFLSLQKSLRAKPVVMDIPKRCADWRRMLESFGFREQRPLIRMILRNNRNPGEDGITFAISGPELG
ncbi:MAG TPA: GNAT family N-acetyltransferase [Candidatus Brocadiia bacterium]|nr:GNAT family N-acetyltransferase [Candidatus Brocadiia bacterium]